MYAPDLQGFITAGFFPVFQGEKTNNQHNNIRWQNLQASGSVPALKAPGALGSTVSPQKQNKTGSVSSPLSSDCFWSRQPLRQDAGKNFLITKSQKTVMKQLMGSTDGQSADSRQAADQRAKQEAD